MRDVEDIEMSKHTSAMFLGILIGFCPLLLAQEETIEEMEFVMGVRQTYENSVGASDETIERIQSRFMESVEGKYVVFERALMLGFLDENTNKFLGKGTRAGFGVLHQNTDIQVQTVAEPEVLDRLRINQRAWIKVKVVDVALATHGPYATVFGYLVDARPQNTNVRCKNGHEFAPSSGFQFCPKCGAPMESQ